MTLVNIHGNCVVLGTKGVLIRGVSGSGKSELADLLMSEAARAGQFSAHVADDRVVLTATGQRLLAQPPGAIAGLREVRGFGIVRSAHMPLAEVHLVVDLHPAEGLERMPIEAVSQTMVEGIAVPAISCPRSTPHSALRTIRWAFRHLFPESPDYF